jgi:hypothetical protein
VLFNGHYVTQNLKCKTIAASCALSFAVPLLEYSTRKKIAGICTISVCIFLEIFLFYLFRLFQPETFFLDGPHAGVGFLQRPHAQLVGPSGLKF